MKALRCSSGTAVLSAMILLHLLLLCTARAEASPAVFSPGNDAEQGRVPHRHGARRLLRLQPAAATATNTFHVKNDGIHQAMTAPANTKPNMEFNASMRPAPRSNSNPRQN